MKKVFRRSAYLLILATLVMFLSCGGSKSLMEEIPGNGVTLSLQPSVGDTLHYAKKADFLTEISEKGQTKSTISKSTSKYRLLFHTASPDSYKATLFLDSETSGKFEDGQYKESEEESELLGESLTVTVDSSGDLKNYDVSKDLGYTDEGENKNKLTAENYANNLFFYNSLPKKSVHIGTTWTVKTVTDSTLEKGKVKVTDKKIMKVSDFVVHNGHNCVKIKVDIIIEQSSEGETEKEGTTYKYWVEGNGEGSGTIYFDYENGMVVQKSFESVTNFTQTVLEKGAQEKEETSYYQERSTKVTLKD